MINSSNIRKITRTRKNIRIEIIVQDNSPLCKSQKLNKVIIKAVKLILILSIENITIRV
jgi:hypothetical protein